MNKNETDIVVYQLTKTLKGTLDKKNGVLTISGTGKMPDFEIDVCYDLQTCDVTPQIPWEYYKAYIKEVKIQDGVTSIGKRAFRGCSSLTSVTLPDLVTSIGDDAFSACRNLESITLPDSVISIGDYAFSGCSNLASITIGSSVTTIEDYAFSNCPKLKNVKVLSTTPPSIGYEAFDNVPSDDGILVDATLTVPKACYITYKDTKGWGCFKKIITTRKSITH